MINLKEIHSLENKPDLQMMMRTCRRKTRKILLALFILANWFCYHIRWQHWATI